MKKRLSLLTILLFSVVLILNGCRQELLKDDEKSFNPATAKFQFVNIADIPKVAKFIKNKTNRNDLLLPIVSAKKAREGKGSIDFTNLESSVIIKNTERDCIYYIFSIDNAGDDSTIYTFEVKEVDGEVVKAGIIEYASNVPYIEKPEIFANFTGTVSSYNLEGRQTSSVAYVNGDSDCPPSNPGGSDGGGYEPIGNPDPNSPNPGFPYYPGFPSFPPSDGGSGDGGSNSGPSQGCNPNSYVVISSFTYENGDEFQLLENECGTRYTRTVKKLESTISSNRLTADCNDGSGVVIIPIKNGTPCERITALTSNQKFRDNINALGGMTNNSSERGYRMDYGTSTSSNPSGINNQFLQNRPGTNDIDFKYFLPSTFAIIHTHYDSLNDPIFSPGDIIQFNAWLAAAKAWNDNPAHLPKIDLKNLSYTLVTSWGTYILTFDGTDVVPFSGYNISDINTEYINNVILPAMTVANVSGDVSFNMDKLEEGFLKFAKSNLNMPGMKLFKLGSDGNTEIFLNNNKRETNKCN